jgi:hypothetical protein
MHDGIYADDVGAIMVSGTFERVHLASLSPTLGITPGGKIMGLYLDSNYGHHGFLFVPR